MRSLLVANTILIVAVGIAASENEGRRHLNGDGKKKINQRFTTKPKSKSVLGQSSGVTENIELKPGKPSAYEKYFDDPHWGLQWYMHEYRTVDGPVMDHNVVPVYERGFHGQNVRVAVVDDGVVQHYDLQQSYDHKNSLTCGTPLVYKDGSPDYVANFGWSVHGTKQAGVIGMDENDKCGVGVARKAKLISINVCHGWNTRDKYIGQALSYEMNHCDVFCLGWGLPTSAFKNEKLNPYTNDAISNGFTKLLNADNMVELALKWTPVPERHVCFTNKSFDNYKELPKDVEISIALVTDGCQGRIDAIFFLEQIQLDATINYSKRGAPSIVVVSPKETPSQMMHPPVEKNNSVMNNISLKSYQHWGEDPKGTWTVKIKLEGVKGRLNNLRITLYGTKEKPTHYAAKEPYRSYSAFRLKGGETIE